ncbi:Hypothetical predicted protein [Cloeon dipterum]|uniref:Uncharacterized protein n=1 Tax=Cloeon dipterum TaxID=197152 RepID=A0A8S1DM26_9INSE|nr:Hypothetical predicted protein [Cloeon dipterum]
MPAGKKNNRKEKKEKSNKLKISDNTVSQDQDKVAVENQPPKQNKFKKNRKQEVMSLQNSLTKFILENITLFCDKEKYFQNLQNLSKDVQNQILAGLPAEKLKCKGRKPINFKGLSLLLNDKTQELYLDRLVSIFPKNTAYRQDQQVKILTLIATEAINLSTLDVGSLFRFDFYQEDLSRTICKMRNLETLVIPFCHLTYPNLRDLCKNLRNLQYLNFDHLYFPPNCDYGNLEEFKSCFSGLKQLVYVPDESLPASHYSHDVQLYRNCLQHLPQIEIVQAPAYDLQWMVLCDRLITPWSIHQLPEGPSALRSLCTTPTTQPLHTAFPEVTHLMVTWKGDWYMNTRETELLPLLQFSKIEGLQLVKPPSASIVDRFLKAYGPGLQFLVIHQAAEPITFDRTLPQLTGLKLSLTPLSNLGFDSQEVFPKLEELEWTLAEQRLTNAFRLSLILSSPTLEIVKIHRIYPEIFHLLDLQCISVAMNDEQQPLLQNLTNLNLGFYHPNSEVDSRTKSIFQASASLVKSACNRLTNLSTVEFSVRPGGKKEKGLTSEQLVLARIEELKRFVDNDQEFFDCLVNFRIGA